MVDALFFVFMMALMAAAGYCIGWGDGWQKGYLEK